jgi:post-segregation antitoxin (ccd killing protein)
MTQVDDLVKRARAFGLPIVDVLADALEAQAARVKELEKALEPFAEAALNLPEPYCDALEIGSLRDFDLWESAAAMGINASDLIRARALMSALRNAEGKKDGVE